MRLEFQAETIKATPAIAGTILSGLTLNEMVATATLIYVLVQIAYLIWKWRREIKDGKTS